MNCKLIDKLSCEDKIKILSNQIGTVFFFKKDDISSDERWYFVIGYGYKTFYTVLPQSNVSSRLIARDEKRDNLKTLVIINKSDYPELNRESIIDCNTINPVSHEWMINACKNDRFEIRTSCSDILKESILACMRKSNLVPPLTKEIIEACHC